MVKVAIAGGTGDVASEIVDVLVARGKHDILILTRRDRPSSSHRQVTYAKTDYKDVETMTRILHGYDVVLSFLSAHLDQEAAMDAQRTLISACIAAGVPRFAPSEWISSSLNHMPWYNFKGETRKYLEKINQKKKVLEYCLFQPGFFTNYLVGKRDQSKHLTMLETPLDFPNGRVLMREGGEKDYIVWTTVGDLAEVVTRAVEFEGEWPVVGGIQGSRLTMEALIQLGEKFAGKKFVVEKMNNQELETVSFTSSWLPKVEHPSIAPADVEAASKTISAGILLAIGEGGFDVGDEWNKLLPDYKMQDAETFLQKAWSNP